MNLTLKRFQSSALGTFGEMSDGDKIIAFTCEPPLMGDGVKAIPPTEPETPYEVCRYISPHFKREVFLLNDVPGHRYIEMHIGNTVHDTSGCILLGDKIDVIGNQPAVMNSQATLEKLLKELPKEFYLTIENP